MTFSAFNIIAIWGFWLLVVVVGLIMVFLWGYNINRKINYILGRLEKEDRGRNERFTGNTPSAARMTGSAQEKAVSPIVATCIIGAAVLILFIIPVWLINR